MEQQRPPAPGPPRQAIPPHICGDCGWAGVAKSSTPGHIGIEILLWLACLLPGLAYTVWRLSARKPSCPCCHSTRVLSIASPAGRKILWDTSRRTVPRDMPNMPVRGSHDAGLAISVAFAGLFGIALLGGLFLMLLAGGGY